MGAGNWRNAEKMLKSSYKGILISLVELLWLNKIPHFIPATFLAKPPKSGELANGSEERWKADCKWGKKVRIIFVFFVIMK